MQGRVSKYLLTAQQARIRHDLPSPCPCQRQNQPLDLAAPVVPVECLMLAFLACAGFGSVCVGRAPLAPSTTVAMVVSDVTEIDLEA